MQGTHTFRVIGQRPDGTVGIRLFSENQRRAGLLADFVLQQNVDWDVRIEAIPEEPNDKPVILSRSAPK